MFMCLMSSRQQQRVEEGSLKLIRCRACARREAEVMVLEVCNLRAPRLRWTEIVTYYWERFFSKLP